MKTTRSLRIGHVCLPSAPHDQHYFMSVSYPLKTWPVGQLPEWNDHVKPETTTPTFTKRRGTCCSSKKHPPCPTCAAGKPSPSSRSASRSTSLAAVQASHLLRHILHCMPWKDTHPAGLFLHVTRLHPIAEPIAIAPEDANSPSGFWCEPVAGYLRE